MSQFVVSLVVATATILFSFQNCQKPPHPDEINTQALNTVSAATSMVDLGQESVVSLDIFIPDSKIVTKAGNSYQINYNLILKIDLVTGQMVETSDLDSQASTYCLSEQLRNELISILKSSQVCQTQPQLSDDVVCSQAIQSPYAQVFTSKSQYDLGTASDGCGHNLIDLCGDQSSMLKAYIENIKKNYKQLICK